LTSLASDIRRDSVASRPVPAIGGFDRDRRARAGLAALPQQRRPVVVDPHRREQFADRIYPAEHAATTVQIDPDKLARGIVSTHGGLPSRGVS